MLMTQPTATVLVTGISGNLGTRLLPMLSEFRVVGVDLRPPESTSPIEFHAMNLGHESSCRELTQLLRHTGARSVLHLAFDRNPLRAGLDDVERMWQTNVAGTARVMEAISVVNRTGGHVRQFMFPSSVAAYGPETPGPVREDFPLRAHTLPYAMHQRESDEVVRYRAESMGDCRTYLLRPHIFTGPTLQNDIVGALRGIPLGQSPRAARMRAEGKRLPILLPRGKKFADRRFQFVHVDDVARLLVYLLHRSHNDPAVTILNVAAQGEPISIETCAEIAQARITRVPGRAAYQLISRILWKWEISSIPPEALPYMTGSNTVDTTRLQQFLGPDYSRVMRYSVEDALRDSFVRH